MLSLLTDSRTDSTSPKLLRRRMPPCAAALRAPRSGCTRRGALVRSAVESPARARRLKRYLPSMISACTGPVGGPAPLVLRYQLVSLSFSITRRNLVEVAPKVEIQPSPPPPTCLVCFNVWRAHFPTSCTSLCGKPVIFVAWAAHQAHP